MEQIPKTKEIKDPKPEKRDDRDNNTTGTPKNDDDHVIEVKMAIDDKGIVKLLDEQLVPRRFPTGFEYCKSYFDITLKKDLEYLNRGSTLTNLYFVSSMLYKLCLTIIFLNVSYRLYNGLLAPVLVIAFLYIVGKFEGHSIVGYKLLSKIKFDLKNSVESILNPVKKNADKLVTISTLYTWVCAIEANEHTFDSDYYLITAIIFFVFNVMLKIWPTYTDSSFIEDEFKKRADGSYFSYARSILFGILVSLITLLQFLAFSIENFKNPIDLADKIKYQGFEICVTAGAFTALNAIAMFCYMLCMIVFAYIIFGHRLLIYLIFGTQFNFVVQKE